jgi:N-acetyl-anhydromuramyl-L-alanine amidase AmpD
MNIIEVNYKWLKDFETRARTDNIIIHHANAKQCTVQEVHRWHQANNWSGIGYHFFIAKTGHIYRGRPIHTVGAHAKGANSYSVGICLEGDYEEETVVPDIQYKALLDLVLYLKGFYPNVEVSGHNKFSDTSCPGQHFPMAKFLQDIDFTNKDKHWAEKHYNSLIRKGIKITDKRFDDTMTRGEVFAMLDRITGGGI